MRAEVKGVVASLLVEHVVTGGDVHMTPRFGRPHEFVGTNCWCHPAMEDPEAEVGDAPLVFIHNVE